MDKVNRSLRLFSDTLEEWVECQRKWLYLETIFMAPDIQRQLPNETKLFAQVDRQFKSIMRTTRDRPAALQVSLVSSCSLPGVSCCFRISNCHARCLFQAPSLDQWCNCRQIQLHM